MKIEHLKEVDSTNRYILKYLAGGENAIVTADYQTGGRGTNGRVFSSEVGGVYLTALTFYQAFPASESFRVMTHAAVATAKTAEAFGVKAQIKWPNDVFASNRKLAGILIENKLSGGLLKYSVVGIGLNVNNPLNGLEGIAVSLSELTGRKLPLEKVRASLIENLQSKDDMEDYLSRVAFLGKEITVTEGDRVYRAVAKEILPDGRLVVERDGVLRPLSAAEVSLKL